MLLSKTNRLSLLTLGQQMISELYCAGFILTQLYQCAVAASSGRQQYACGSAVQHAEGAQHVEAILGFSLSFEG